MFSFSLGHCEYDGFLETGESGLHTLLKFFDLNAKVNQMWKILHNCEENYQKSKETDGFR